MEEKPKISWGNWCEWCGDAVHRQVNAGDMDALYAMAEKIMKDCELVPYGATHHLRVDYEHLWPEYLEGVDDGED